MTKFLGYIKTMDSALLAGMLLVLTLFHTNYLHGQNCNPLATGAGAASKTVQPCFFGLNINKVTTPWPTSVGVEFGGYRTLSSQIEWSDINVADGVYDWTRFDEWMANAEAGGQQVLYTFYHTPVWASAVPFGTCGPLASSDGGCFAPNDLNADGTGTDQHLKNFVTALMEHVGPGKIKFIEVWNEPNITTEFDGTIAQLVRMAQDVRTIAKAHDPNIQIVSPAETGDGMNSLQMGYLDKFLAAGGGQFVDIIALHGYVGPHAEDVGTRIANTQAVMARFSQSGKPVFVTEGGYGPASDGSDGPGWTVRHLLTQLGNGAERFFLFDFDATNLGILYDTTTGSLTANGIAYQQVYDWLVGRSVSALTLDNAGTYRLSVTGVNGFVAQVIWNPSTSVKVTPSATFRQYRDLSGVVHAFSGSIVVSSDPILLQN
jgi:hypothetical protein